MIRYVLGAPALLLGLVILAVALPLIFVTRIISLAVERAEDVAEDFSDWIGS